MFQKNLKQRCPRRDESVNPDAYGDGTDTPDQWRKDGDWLTCSYCGSLHPDEFMTICREGTQELGPTDKNYKVYVAGLNVRGAGKFYFQHLSEDQRREFVDLYNSRARREYADDMTFTIAKDEGGKMAVGYPGTLRAFFMGKAS